MKEIFMPHLVFVRILTVQDGYDAVSMSKWEGINILLTCTNVKPTQTEMFKIWFPNCLLSLIRCFFLFSLIVLLRSHVDCTFDFDNLVLGSCCSSQWMNFVMTVPSFYLHYVKAAELEQTSWRAGSPGQIILLWLNIKS